MHSASETPCNNHLLQIIIANANIRWSLSSISCRYNSECLKIQPHGENSFALASLALSIPNDPQNNRALYLLQMGRRRHAKHISLLNE